MSERKEVRVEVSWPDQLNLFPVNMVRISRVGHDVQIRCGYSDIAPIVDAMAGGAESVDSAVAASVDLVMSSTSFHRVFQNMTEIYEAMRKSGHLPALEETDG